MMNLVLYKIVVNLGIIEVNKILDTIGRSHFELVETNWCECGDFNSVWGEEERKGRTTFVFNEDASQFINFIDDSKIVNFPLHERIFTWSRLDGSSKSILYRFVLLLEWCNMWPDSVKHVLIRRFLDHRLIMLSVAESKWGPHPFQMLKCWSKFPSYHEFVEEQWHG